MAISDDNSMTWLIAAKLDRLRCGRTARNRVNQDSQQWLDSRDRWREFTKFPCQFGNRNFQACNELRENLADGTIVLIVRDERHIR